MRLYYNRARGPLPPTSLVQLKAGLNRWEEIVVVDMERVAGIEVGWFDSTDGKADVYTRGLVWWCAWSTWRALRWAADLRIMDLPLLPTRHSFCLTCRELARGLW